MQVSEVYSPRLLTCRATDTLTAVARVLTEEKVGALAVVDGPRIAGIISERDLTRAVADGVDLAAVTADQYATTRFKVALLEDDVKLVAGRMVLAGVRHLPVVGDGELAGMVSMRDLLGVEAFE